ncbi:hypothetical protein GJ496_007579 [Pomphorhynchus laevis]|nr:hypothetical protein GJ496_007579 [Pomphorhynchus laevis]
MNELSWILYISKLWFLFESTKADWNCKTDVYLIRNAQATLVNYDGPLTPYRGKYQPAVVAGFMRTIFINKTIDILMNSERYRANRTAKLMAQYLREAGITIRQEQQSQLLNNVVGSVQAYQSLRSIIEIYLNCSTNPEESVHNVVVVTHSSVIVGIMCYLLTDEPYDECEVELTPRVSHVSSTKLSVHIDGNSTRITGMMVALTADHIYKSDYIPNELLSLFNVNIVGSAEEIEHMDDELFLAMERWRMRNCDPTAFKLMIEDLLHVSSQQFIYYYFHKHRYIYPEMYDYMMHMCKTDHEVNETLRAYIRQSEMRSSRFLHII